METITVRRRGAAAIVELCRPDSLNAWNAQLGDELLAALRDAEADDGVRAVCLTGAGRAFSSGADLDLREMGTGPGDDPLERLERTLVERYHPIIAAVRRLPKPVLAAVNGPAAGIGCSLALAADLVVARESAYFLLAFVNIGLVADGGASLLVPARIGFARAAELMLLGERLPATRAAEWGLINRAVPDDDFDAEVGALLDRLAAGPTRAYAGIKAELGSWMLERIDAQLDLEAATQREMARTADFAEGVAAFTERRAASFRGA
jgi:2-(1,2-epoxy-1,2-dihydrophenyl)acetyl-CoA isomerase